MDFTALGTGQHKGDDEFLESLVWPGGPPPMSTADRFEFFAFVVLITLLGVLVVKLREWAQQRQLRKHNAGLAALARAQRAGQERGRQEETNVGPTTDFLSQETVVEQFFQRAAEQPEKVALISSLRDGQRRELRYGELAEAIKRLADQLVGLGVGEGSIVMVALERGVHQVIAIYATMFADAAWTPIDPAAPQHRFSELVKDCRPILVLREDGETSAHLASWCDTRGIRSAVLSPDRVELSDNDLQNMTTPRKKEHGLQRSCNMAELKGSSTCPKSLEVMDSQALVIYTSGTTGQPKGIVYSHAMINHGVGATAHLMEMTDQSVAFLKTPAIWAVAEWEFFPALTKGATLIVGTPDGHKDPEYMADTIRKEGVTCLVMAPDVLDLLLDIHEVGGQLQGLKHVISVGAGMPVALANRFVSAPRVSAQLHNVYGASESSCTIYTVPKGGIDTSLWPNRAPVGVPQPGCSVWLLDAERNRVPIGEEGEVCFGGQLAVGYWDNPDLTAEKFVMHPELGRIYCSGDVAKWKAGVLEICGRKDRQVKIRGVRVEPEEVENAMRSFRFPSKAPATARPPGGADAPLLDADTPARAAVAAATSLTQVGCVATSGSSPDLVAFVAPDVGDAGVAMVQDHLQATLPSYYVPKYVFTRAALPRLANGKVDIKELAKEADKRVGEGSTEVVMDSLGRMRTLSKSMMLETQVIHRCYAYWMLGVLCDHWNACGFFDWTPFCVVENQPGIVPAWVELLTRAVGNDQDMFGFIFLGALQHSRLAPGETKITLRLSYTDFFCFLIYLLAGFPIPQLLRWIFGDLIGTGCEVNWADAESSAHRWYLFMIVWAHVCMYLCQLIHMPAWAQALGHFALAVSGEQWYDPCSREGTPDWVKWVASWLVPYAFRKENGWTHEVTHTCPIMRDWIEWYVVFYVIAFYYSRPIMQAILPIIERAGLNSAAWAVVAFGTSVLLGSVQAAYHYPNVVMEFGIKDENFKWFDVPLEFGVNMLQPILVALAMVWLPFDFSWWGNTTLGTYLLHFYVASMGPLYHALQWVHGWAAPAHALPQIVVILGAPILFMSTLGPLFHYMILSPSIIYRKAGILRWPFRESRGAQEGKLT